MPQATTNPARRTLKFDDFDAVVRDAEHLLAAGYQKAGNWDLAQCCDHLVEWMRFPMDGFPPSPLPIRLAFAVLRPLVGRRELRTILTTGRMKSVPTNPATVVPAGGDPAAAVGRLRDTVGRMKAFTGEPKPSPFFGPMTREEWFGLNLAHAAHHLSFLVPKM